MKNKTWKKIWNAVTWVLVLAVAVTAFLLSGIRVLGLTPYTVLSGSMEPVYPVGSLIYVKPVSAEEVAVGDPITFHLTQDGTVATHRVVNIDTENKEFHTKGDANEQPDASGVAFSNLIGKPIFSLPYLGFFSDWITAVPGMYIGICFGGLLILMLLVPGLLEKSESKKKTKDDSAVSGTRL